MNYAKKIKAFTLVEVLVSLVLISIITFTTLMVFTSINSSSDPVVLTLAKEQADLLLIDAISKKHFYNDKTNFNGYEIHRNFLVSPAIKNTGALEISVLQNNKIIYLVKQHVNLNE